MKDRRVKTIAFILIFVVIALTTYSVYTFHSSFSHHSPWCPCRWAHALVFYPRIWVNSTGSLAAFILHYDAGVMPHTLEEVGPTYVDNITVNDVECPWSNVYYWRAPNGTTINWMIRNVRYNMNVSKTAMTTTEASFNLTIATGNITLTKATSNMLISPDRYLLIYVQSPRNITVNDIGTLADIDCYFANGFIAEGGCRTVESATQ